MSKILLKSLEVSNFKGIKTLSINFEGKNANVFGENAAGKTTVFDAFSWGLFGKNSNGEAKFNIKPLSADGSEVSGLDSVVTIVIEKDGIETTFTRNYHEDWKTPRGKAEKVFNGHKTEYLVNEGNVSQKEYQNRVNDIIDEKIFKMLTDVYAFTSMKDKEQREVLFKVLGGDIPIEDIIASNRELKPLESLLATTKLEFLESETKGQIKKNKEEKEKIPSRIDELENMKVDVDVAAIQGQVEELQQEIKTLDHEINNANTHNKEIESKQDEYKAKQYKYNDEYAKTKNQIETQHINHLYAQINKKEQEYTNEFNKIKSEVDSKYDLVENMSKMNKLNNELSKKASKLYPLQEEKKTSNEKIKIIDSNIKILRTKVEEVKNFKFTFDENIGVCPTCKRSLENIDEIKATKEREFTKQKDAKLFEMKELGNKHLADKKALVDRIAAIEIEVKEIESTTPALEKEITEIDEMLRNKPDVSLENFPSLRKINDECNALQSQIRNVPELEIKSQELDKLQEEINTLKAFLENNKLIDTTIPKSQKKALEDKLEGFKGTYNQVLQNNKIEDRINELLDRERELANKKASLEGTLHLLDVFSTTKANLITNKINERFENISFKLFESYYSSDGIKEICECTIQGVPYSNANTAARINAGLEIIQVLSSFYNVSCPIFIDGAESITHIKEMDSQLITLNVEDLTALEDIKIFEEHHTNATKINKLYVEVIE